MKLTGTAGEGSYSASAPDATEGNGDKKRRRTVTVTINHRAEGGRSMLDDVVTKKLLCLVIPLERTACCQIWLVYAIG